MVGARSAAMGFNRLVDARFDALNPRTAMRELPRGAMSRWEAALFVVVSSAVFVYARVAVEHALPACWRRWRWRSCSGTRWPSGSRPTRSCSSGWRWRWRRSADGSPPAGGGGPEPWLLGLAIGLWVGGFDILYACQDVDFDRGHGLRSIPARFGVASAIQLSRVMHVGTVIAMAALWSVADLPALYLGGVAVVACCWSTSSRSSALTTCRRSRRRFDLNGYVGIVYFAATALALYIE